MMDKFWEVYIQSVMFAHVLSLSLWCGNCVLRDVVKIMDQNDHQTCYAQSH